MAHHKNKKSPLRCRASAFSLHRRGSITLEAAVVVSFFFFGALSLVYLFELMAIQTTIANGLYAAGKEMAMECCTNPMFTSSQVKKKLIEQVGREQLDKMVIVGGADGLDCGKSKKYWNTSIMDLTVSYQVEIPVLLFRIPILRQTESIRVKGWTGYEGNGSAGNKEDAVYVTEHGFVYHEKRDCTYLDFSVKTTDQDKVSELRNQSGGRYYPCGYCGGKTEKQFVYVTEYGDRYHNTLNCSRIKRKVYEIQRKQAYGMGGCSKCTN